MGGGHVGQMGDVKKCILITMNLSSQSAQGGICYYTMCNHCFLVEQNLLVSPQNSTRQGAAASPFPYHSTSEEQTQAVFHLLELKTMHL
jgi:hypothetical protein